MKFLKHLIGVIIIIALTICAILLYQHWNAVKSWLTKELACGTYKISVPKSKDGVDNYTIDLRYEKTSLKEGETYTISLLNKNKKTVKANGVSLECDAVLTKNNVTGGLVLTLIGTDGFSIMINQKVVIEDGEVSSIEKSETSQIFLSGENISSWLSEVQYFEILEVTNE